MYAICKLNGNSHVTTENQLASHKAYLSYSPQVSHHIQHTTYCHFPLFEATLWMYSCRDAPVFNNIMHNVTSR